MDTNNLDQGNLLGAADFQARGGGESVFVIKNPYLKIL